VAPALVRLCRVQQQPWATHGPSPQRSGRWQLRVCSARAPSTVLACRRTHAPGHPARCAP
jgi:hypothetical protein